MTPRPPPVEIVIGVLLRPDGRFLVQPRTGDPAMEGLWELPGGKVAEGEPRPAALAREVAEETGLEVAVEEAPLCGVGHAYPDRRVALWVHRCEVRGDPPAPRGARWVTVEEYAGMPMPEANAAIVAALERWGTAAP